MIKPFSLEKLSARVRSQLRNAQSHPTQQLEFANLVLDTQSKQVKVDDQQVNLTAKEFQILHKLMQNPQHVVTREQLEESLYAWGDEIESNAIEVFINQLRKKMAVAALKPYEV